MARKQGVVGYATSLDAALKDARVTGKPMVLKAEKLAEPGSSNLVLSATDATKLKNLGALLRAAKVVIVID